MTTPGVVLEGMFAFQDDVLTTEAGSKVVRDLRVFRTGTFIDMFGREKTYELEDLLAAAQNFRVLRDQNILPNVPVRVDHTFSMKDVGGYFLDVRVEGEFLLADIEFTDLAMARKYEEGTFRNRSLEIGQYVTNGGQEYDPVVLGLAFVDLPAVEGLYRLSTGDNMGTEDTEATEETTEEPAEETEETTVTGDGEEPAEETEEADETEATEDRTPVGAHGRPHTFRIHGRNTRDFGLVQAHIDALERTLEENVTSNRVAFVDGLAEDRKITGPQAEQFRKLVEDPDMTDAQFQAFKAGFEGQAAPEIFGRHDTGGGDDTSETTVREDRITVLREIVANHQRLGTPEDRLHSLPSWKELQELERSA